MGEWRGGPGDGHLHGSEAVAMESVDGWMTAHIPGGGWTQHVPDWSWERGGEGFRDDSHVSGPFLG